MKKTILCCLSFILAMAGEINAQNSGSVIDSSEYNAKVAEAALMMQKSLIGIMDSAKLAYEKDPRVFTDKNGELSTVKFYIYIVNFLSPMRQQGYTFWAEKCLNKQELAYFKTIKFKVNTKYGIKTIVPEQAITYDMDWLTDLYVNSTLLINPAFNYFDHVFYLTNLDVTGIIQPPFVTAYVPSPAELNKLMNNLIVSSSFEFFTVMHEFYHLYYEQQPQLKSPNELAADRFALEKWKVYTKSTDSDRVVNDQVLASTYQTIGASSTFNFFKTSLISCNTSRMMNDNIRLKDFSNAFLGLRMAQMLFRNDSRFFFTNRPQLELDLKRAHEFADIASRLLKCEGSDTTGFCCFISQQIDELKQLDHLQKEVGKLEFSKLLIGTKYYDQLNKQGNGFMAFNLGNYYAVSLKDPKKALLYYQSGNKSIHKSGFTVLCNLISYEIYTHHPILKNADLAKECLDRAISLNASLHALSDDLIQHIQ